MVSVGTERFMLSSRPPQMLTHATNPFASRPVCSLEIPAYVNRLEGYFEFTRLGTNWRTEILAGVTTFLTMAYIVLVNPAILSAAGMPLAP